MSQQAAAGQEAPMGRGGGRGMRNMRYHPRAGDATKDQQYSGQAASNLGHRCNEMCTVPPCLVHPYYCNADHTLPHGGCPIAFSQPLRLDLDGGAGKCLRVPICVCRKIFISCIVSSIAETAVLSTPKDWKIKDAIACAILL